MANRKPIDLAPIMPEVLPIQAAAPEPSRLTLDHVPVDFQAASGESKRPTFSILGYSGAPMNVSGFYHPVIVDLTGLKAASQTIPALRGHDPNRIVGQTDSIKIGSEVIFSGTVTGDNADAHEVVSQAKNGFRWQASIGADVVRREFVEAGKRVTVNGRDLGGPLIIARETMLGEISFVAMGADQSTAATVAAQAKLGESSKGLPTMYEQWLSARGFDVSALSDQQKTSLRGLYDAEQAAKAAELVAARTPAPEANGNQRFDDVFDRIKAERERVDGITALAEKACNDRPDLVETIRELARSAIDSKSTTVSEFELSTLRLFRPAASAPGIHGSTDLKTSGRLLEAAVCISGGLADVEEHFDERTLNLASEQFRHGIGLRDLLGLCAKANGYNASTGNDVRGLLQAAFGMDRRNGLRADSGFSNAEISGILSNIANKFLLQGFNAVDSAWQKITSTRAVRDFKTITSYMLTGSFIYEKVGAAGDLKHATAGQLSYTNRAETYGRMFAITRQDIINDDLGALSAVPMKLGRGAALKINDIFWSIFLNNSTFFTSGNLNVTTGGTSALSSDALKEATVKFRKQTDPDGMPIAVEPLLLVVPSELEIPAIELMTSALVNTGGSSTTAKVPNRNVWNQKFEVVASPYLSNSTYTGYSTTAWYLLANPNDLPVIEIAFLNGRQTPIVESADVDFETLGVQMRGYMDYGVSLVEFRGGVRAAGN